MNARRLKPVLLAAALAGCGGGGSEVRQAQPPAPSGTAVAAPGPARWPSPGPYEPVAAETYPNGKRLAGRTALRATTYPQGTSALEVARRLGPAAAGTRSLAAAIEPLVDPRMRSRGTIVYPQLSGVTPTSLGAMVVVRQRLRGADARSRAETRVLDVRLRRSGGPWRLDRIASVGGRAPRRPADLSPAAHAVLDDGSITLSDSARWDIQRGDIDEGLLRALADAADRYRLAVSVLRSGHPRRVWETTRTSAHARGYAADIYAVDGDLVVGQQSPGDPAYELTAGLVEGGAEQVGSPWVLAPGGSTSFTDEVHEDHVHLQWSALP